MIEVESCHPRLAQVALAAPGRMGPGSPKFCEEGEAEAGRAMKAWVQEELLMRVERSDQW